jgi:MSHA biogenesis protein MshK
MAQSMRHMLKAGFEVDLTQRLRNVCALFVSSLLAIRVAVICLFGMAVSSAAFAEKLNDPTRPANLVALNQSGNGSDNEADGALILQSILIGPKRSSAIISGRSVTLNGSIGDYVLVRLSETEAVLSRGKTSLTLKLFPNFEKKAIKKE